MYTMVKFRIFMVRELIRYCANSRCETWDEFRTRLSFSRPVFLNGLFCARETAAFILIFSKSRSFSPAKSNFTQLSSNLTFKMTENLQLTEGFFQVCA